MVTVNSKAYLPVSIVKRNLSADTLGDGGDRGAAISSVAFYRQTTVSQSPSLVNVLW